MKLVIVLTSLLIGFASSLGISALLALSSFAAQAIPTTSNAQIASQPPHRSEKQLVMTEDNAPYSELMMNGWRGFSKEEALRLFGKAKSRAQGFKDPKRVQEAEDAIKNVDQIDFAANRRKAADNLERGVSGMREEGRIDDANALQFLANRVRSGEVKGIYDMMR
ncbi:hypothetical protein SD80_004715 [Scytonema tolypothrichoides VB-61278]|nr:hypothetical protein SD80_004715 [Scytonema tolypothrichoides VB-61278]